MNYEIIILIELILIFGGVLTFALWELRAVRKKKQPLPIASNAPRRGRLDGSVKARGAS